KIYHPSNVRSPQDLRAIHRGLYDGEVSDPRGIRRCEEFASDVLVNIEVCLLLASVKAKIRVLCEFGRCRCVRIGRKIRVYCRNGSSVEESGLLRAVIETDDGDMDRSAVEYPVTIGVRDKDITVTLY